ncbi:uncharacterized protein ASCRUDRAFT_74185 [Ascoidea rubescens DSM 1968]|uniref:Uncharacterized protein n=1 Tax=Ascoidea rubescens DSM 1968 TaxID=1344418 RepID=A0A1D2VM64_9ASCO|nr:hypothetical protein ASCRUDRAFT_74185 [Ascoidea rubescens DSM 1968]ODV62701.1 hypothetical protein ASCRUDRAFT_74185 [Ascoidea rubescens DSM 1968]
MNDSDDNISIHSTISSTSTLLKADYFNKAEDILSSDFLIFKIKLENLPDFQFSSSVCIQSLNIDLSDLVILTGISKIFENVFLPMDDNYLLESIKINKKLNKTLKPEKKSTIEQILFQHLPDWFTIFSVSFSDFSLVLGARSIFMEADLLKQLPLSYSIPNDMIEDSLRKICYKFDNASCLLTRNNSCLGDDDKILSKIFAKTQDRDSAKEDTKSNQSFYGDISFNGTSSTSGESISEDDDPYWLVDFKIKNLIGKTIMEPSNEKIFYLQSKNFFKMPMVELTSIAFHKKDYLKDLLKVNVSVDRFDLLFSHIIYFLIVSSVSLIRNTVFSFYKKVSKSPIPIVENQILNKNNGFNSSILDFLVLSGDFGSIDIVLQLPNNFKMRYENFHSHIKLTPDMPSIFSNSEVLRLCVKSPTVSGFWATLVNVNYCQLLLNFDNLLEYIRCKNEKQIDLDTVLEICSHSIRFSIPHQFVIHKLFDNLGTFLKVAKQLNYSLKNNSPGIVIKPHAVPPVIFPKIHLKSRRGIFSMDDDPFESELSMIFQIGIAEQKERLSKLNFFIEAAKHSFHDEDVSLEESSCFSVVLRNKNSIFSIKDYYKIDDQDNISSNFMERESVSQKLDVLQRNLSKSWLKRVEVYKQKMAQEISNNADFLYGLLSNNMGSHKHLNRRLLENSLYPPLMSIILENLDLKIDRVDFPIDSIPKYIHDIGKGVPYDTEYTLLLPFNIDLKLSELRVHLRDYPLPLLYIPSISDNQFSSIPSVHIHGNCIIAEDFFDSPSNIRNVFVPLVYCCDQRENLCLYSLLIPRTVASIKMFPNLVVDINTSKPTKFTWGSSQTACIQQIMLIFDAFTKPPLDPSDKIGFWDKLRANVHARIRFNWNDHGDLHILFKGSRSPYELTGSAAGFILCFKGNVILDLNRNDDPKDFLVVDADQVMWVIPNHLAEPLLVWSRHSSESVFLPTSSLFVSSIANYYLEDDYKTELPFVNRGVIAEMSKHYFEKVTIQLSGNVQFKMGINFERMITKTQRSSEFTPHYLIKLTNPDYVEDLSKYDAYEKFRSHFVHMAFSLVSPSTSNSRLKTQKGPYNTVHLTQRSIEHFFAWWKLFSGNMSLPIRHGKIFGPETSTKKFAQYLDSIKYQFLISPLFMSHFQRDNEKELSLNEVYSYGMKGKLDSFALDLHQKKELFVKHYEKLNLTKRVTQMKFEVGEMIISNFDIRIIEGILKNQVPNGTYSGNHSAKVRTFDNDLSWYDRNDFEEVGTNSLETYKATARIFPLMFTPHLSYYRQTNFDESYVLSNNNNCVAHDCILGKNYWIDTQFKLTQERMDQIKKEIQLHKATLETKTFDDKHYSVSLQKIIENLEKRFLDLCKIHEDLMVFKENPTSCDATYLQDVDFSENEKSRFNNQFIVHNMLLKWNVHNRNFFYKYIHLVNLESTMDEYLGNKAVSYFRDIIVEQNDRSDEAALKSTLSRIEEESKDHNQPLQFSYDKKSCVDRLKFFEEDLAAVNENDVNLSHENDYCFKLILPQIQLIKDENVDSCVLVIAPSIQLNIVSIIEKKYKQIELLEKEETDVISVEKRFGAILNQANVFVFSKGEVATNANKLFTGIKNYGSLSNWPPWLGPESCHNNNLLSNNLLLEKTSITVRYDRVNPMVLMDENYGSIRRNKVIVECPKVVVSCDSSQYSAFYSIIINLLIYSEPTSKTLNEKLEKMIIKSDLSNLSSYLDQLKFLQETAKLLRKLELCYSFRKPLLLENELSDYSAIGNQKYETLVQLYLLMKVVNLGGKKYQESHDTLEWAIRADQIILHMLEDDRKPFLDVALANSKFNRLESPDGSNRNAIDIGIIQCFNLEKDVLYQEFFSPFTPKGSEPKSLSKSDNLVRIEWKMDKPVGGIKVIRNFNVKLQPVKIQLEQKTGEKIFHYLFPNDYNQVSIVENGGGNQDSTLVSGSSTLTNFQSRKKNSELRSKQRIIEYEDDEDDGKEEGDDDDDDEDYSDTSFSSNSMNSRIVLDDGYDEESDDDGDDDDEDNGSNGSNDGFSIRNGSKSSSLSLRQDTKISLKEEGGTPVNRKFTLRSHRINGIQNNSTTLTSLPNIEEQDEVDEMIGRASKYLSIVSFQVNHCILCVSYKGAGKTKLINVNDFVLKLPLIHFSNRVWTLLDLAMNLKKIVIKSLLAHTGQLIGNKLKHHRNKNKKIMLPLRQLTHYESFTSISDLRKKSVPKVLLRSSSSKDEEDKEL